MFSISNAKSPLLYSQRLWVSDTKREGSNLLSNNIIGGSNDNALEEIKEIVNGNND
jgi:hypothetical protein